MEKKIRVTFGLQPEHIKIIEEVLDDFGSSEFAWQRIGEKIGWHGPTACYHYVRHLREIIENKK